MAFCFLAANPLAACPVCFSAKKDTLVIYQASTVILSAIPLFLIGATVWLIRRYLRSKF